MLSNKLNHPDVDQGILRSTLGVEPFKVEEFSKLGVVTQAGGQQAVSDF